MLLAALLVRLGETVDRIRCEALLRSGRSDWCIGLHPATLWRDARLADPPSNSKAGAIQERDLVGPAFGQRAAPSRQAAVVLEAATSAKQQSALETRRRLQRVKDSPIDRQRSVVRSMQTRQQDDGRAGHTAGCCFRLISKGGSPEPPVSPLIRAPAVPSRSSGC